MFRVACSALATRSHLARTPPTPDHSRVTFGNGRIEHPSLSSDGLWLAYDLDRGGNSDIYKLRLDGGEPIQVTTDPANDFAPEWSPDGEEIAFHSTRGRGISRDIFVIAADGRGERQLTDTPRREWYAKWMDGGRGIAFASDSGGPLEPYAVLRGAGGSWTEPERLPAGPDRGRRTLVRPFGLRHRRDPHLLPLPGVRGRRLGDGVQAVARHVRL
jgi:dipeptidyl aminopeptidase/acylaminoacyl peptidase